MRKIKYYLLASTAFLLAVAACTSQDDIYKKYVKAGGYNYPAMPINLSSVSGYQRLFIEWEKPMDPAVKTAILYWDNYSSSRSIDYSDYPSGIVDLIVDSLEDRSYTFDIVNIDSDGNKSLPAEITASAYSDSWMVSRSERTVNSAEMSGDSAIIMVSKGTDEMIATRFRYKNENNEWVDCDKVLSPDERTISFPKALKGKRFQYSSSFCPEAGRDTVWSTWITSTDGISYQLNAKRWSVAATSGQVYGENTPEKIFDEKILSGYRWYSSRSDDSKLIFPKILAIDTQTSTGDEYAFTKFVFCENPASNTLRYIKSVVMYVGSSPFDPDDTDFSNDFGIPFLSTVLSTSTAQQTLSATQGSSGRYVAVVFTDSWNTADGYIDLWELIPYGYIPSQAD
ncbi:MAG: DUF4998 domain-containing protein [Bacteroidales bacterium]|jgi:hypothetical protein|nr:DUF4998 domain-containing protein [Bacteroidales bacterium]MCI1785656.1 DUF4998 domain-containing protein [Bacteroidales bacterium]